MHDHASELLAGEGGMSFLALETLVFIGAFPKWLVADIY